MATFLDDLNTSENEIVVYDESKVVSTGMPLEHYIKEVVLGCNRFYKKQSVLAEKGMDFTLVAKLETLSGACRQLYTAASDITFPTSANLTAWQKASEEADYLLYDIKEAGIYACRNDSALVSKIYAIYNEGASASDKIQDLNTYSVFGYEYQASFVAIGYDLANFKRAAELAKEMDKLLALATLDRSATPEFTMRRDKAFTITKKLVDELNAQARFIFRGEKSKAAEFMIAPPRKKAAKVVPEPAPEPVHP